MSDLAKLAMVAAGAGVAGWGLEAFLFGPRYSAAFGDAKVPFLPVYAAGGAIVWALQPSLEGMHPLVRAAVYGTVLTGAELAAGLAERSLGKTSWAYGPDGHPISLRHSLAWAGLGLLAGYVVKEIRRP